MEGRKQVFECGLLSKVMDDLDGASFEFQGLILQIACNISQFPPVSGWLRQEYQDQIEMVVEGSKMNEELCGVAKRALEQVKWEP